MQCWRVLFLLGAWARAQQYPGLTSPPQSPASCEDLDTAEATLLQISREALAADSGDAEQMSSDAEQSASDSPMHEVVSVLEFVVEQLDRESCAVGVPGGLKALYEHFASAVREVLDTVEHVAELWSSKDETFPLQTAETVYLGAAGNTSYLGVLMPDYNKLTSFLPYSQDEPFFIANWLLDLGLRTVQMVIKTSEAQKGLDGSTVHHTYNKLAEEVNSNSQPSNLSWVQGVPDDSWKEDDFAGQLIGHTLLASLLEGTGNNGELVLDLTGSGDDSSPVQEMKRKVISYVPSVLLKAKGYLQYDGNKSPTLVKVDVYDSDGENRYTFDPSSGVQWELAKMVLVAEALYVIEGYHTGIHLFGGAMVAAIKKALPAGSASGELVKPQTVLTIFALFEEAVGLHANHSSSFNGRVWPTDNVTRIWEVTRDMARFYTETSPEDFLGAVLERPEWWAGMAPAFIEPIRKFASSVAGELAKTSKRHLQSFQAELQDIGLIASGSALDVTSQAGLAQVLENLLFATGICHTHMFSTREFFTPLMGWVSTVEMLPYLKGAEKATSLNKALSAAYPNVPGSLAHGFVLHYGTGSGFSNRNGLAPQLGDGPYHVAEDTPLGHAISRFQAELAFTREAIYKNFGDLQSGAFVPGYFYPKELPLPFGFGITQTVYI